MNGAQRRLSGALLAAAIIAGSGIEASAAENESLRVDEALQNITSINRPGRVGYATVWDGNKYIQCRRQMDRALSCEAAGTSLQPTLRKVLTGDRLNRLAKLGWILDPSFGNYVRMFPANTPTAAVAEEIVRALAEVYDVNFKDLEITTTWMADVRCPQRNGPSQNLAGLINDAASMRGVAIYTCSYKATEDAAQKADSVAELIAIYGSSVTAEIQRLRINAANRVYTVFGAGIGYVQCMPETPTPVLYCEAQSAESWPALSAIVTPERVAKLHGAGYADPGRAPNYWKSYPFDKNPDNAIAREILTILYEVYGYAGATKLNIKTEGEP